MNRSIPAAIRSTTLALALLAAGASAAPTPVAANGRLKVKGTQLVNERGDAVQLRGVASHGLQWFGSFYGKGAAFEAAADEWGADVVRLTLYLSESGYLTSKTLTKADFETMIDDYVRACVRKGIYVILDWHVHKPGYPAYYQKEAREFFAKMAAKYGALPNIMWEICNEPSSAGMDEKQSDGTGTDPGHYVEWAEIRKYAEDIIPIIRASSPNSVILVGTPSWSSLGISSKGDDAWRGVADNPLPFPDILYVIHYYAAAHGFMAAFEKASERLPLFATEWAASGFQNTSALDEAKGKAFVDMLARRKIGWAYWCYANDGKDPSVFSMFDKTTTESGPFDPKGGNITATGRLVHRWLSVPEDAWAGWTTATAPRAHPRPDAGGMAYSGAEGRVVVRLGGTDVRAYRTVDGRNAPALP